MMVVVMMMMMVMVMVTMVMAVLMVMMVVMMVTMVVVMMVVMVLMVMMVFIVMMVMMVMVLMVSPQIYEAAAPRHAAGREGLTLWHQHFDATTGEALRRATPARTVHRTTPARTAAVGDAALAKAQETKAQILLLLSRLAGGLVAVGGLAAWWCLCGQSERPAAAATATRPVKERRLQTAADLQAKPRGGGARARNRR